MFFAMLADDKLSNALDTSDDICCIISILEGTVPKILCYKGINFFYFIEHIIEMRFSSLPCAIILLNAFLISICISHESCCHGICNSSLHCVSHGDWISCIPCYCLALFLFLVYMVSCLAGSIGLLKILWSSSAIFKLVLAFWSKVWL